MLRLYISFRSRRIFIAGEKEIVNYVFFQMRCSLFMCKRSDLGIITLMKRLLSGPDLHTGYCSLCVQFKKEKKKKDWQNCFKFILYLSPSSPPSLTPWDAGSWRCSSGWDAVSSPSDWSGSTVTVFLYRTGWRGGDFNTKALQWGNVALSGFRVYVNVVGRIARKLEWGFCMNVFYFCMNVHCVRGVYLPERVPFFFL